MQIFFSTHTFWLIVVGKEQVFITVTLLYSSISVKHESMTATGHTWYRHPETGAAKLIIYIFSNLIVYIFGCHPTHQNVSVIMRISGICISDSQVEECICISADTWKKWWTLFCFDFKMFSSFCFKMENVMISDYIIFRLFPQQTKA